MKTTIAIVLLLCSSAIARAENFGYVDISRVYQTASQPARELAGLQAEKLRVDAAKAAADKSLLPHSAHSDADAQEQAFLQHQKDVFNALQAKLTPILVELKAKRHLGEILPVAPLTPSKADLTDEVIKRWNALDVQAMVDENVRLKAENAKLLVSQPLTLPAGQTKPAAPPPVAKK